MTGEVLAFGSVAAYWCRPCALEFRTRRAEVTCPRCGTHLVLVVLEESA